MITARQSRAARALLGWSRKQLAKKALVSSSAVARLERGEVDSLSSTIIAVQKAIFKAGVELVAADESKGEGARMAKPDL
jgi:predicted transcriptional regulator